MPDPQPYAKIVASLTKPAMPRTSSPHACVPAITPAVLTLKECAVYLHIGQSTLYEKARFGLVPSIKLGGRILFPKTDLEAWMSKEVKRRMGRG